MQSVSQSTLSARIAPDGDASAVLGSHVYLNRNRVNELIEKAMKRPLVLILAGAGYGKTYAVNSFLQKSKIRQIWLQISEFDNLDEHFWKNYATAIAALNKTIAAKLLSFGFPKSERQFEQYSALLECELPASYKYALVLDDFHLISEKAVPQFVERMICAPRHNIPIILISRSEPCINIIGLDEKGLVSYINESDLHFDKDETSKYFSLLGITLPPNSIADIYAGTDGWAFAIYLLGLSLKNDARHKDYAFSAMKLNIFKMIESEIFSVSSKALQSFLIRLSLISHMPLELLRELSEGSDALSEMGRLSSFVRYDSFTNSYRVHHLFLEFLRGKQSQMGEDEKREVYLKTAKWCAANDYKLDAVAYCENAGDFKTLAEIAYSLTRMTPSRVAEFLLDVLGRIPEWAFRENPELYVTKIKLLQSLAQFSSAESYARELIAEYEALPRSRLNCWLLSECYFNLGYIGIYTDLHTNSHEHYSNFESGFRYFQLSGCMSKGLRERAIVGSYVQRVGYASQKGDLERGCRVFSQYVKFVFEAKDNMMMGMSELAFCESAYYKSDIKEAERLAYQAIGKARHAEQFQIENRALFFLLRINIYSANFEKIKEIFRQLELQLENKEFFNGYTLNEIVNGWFFAQIRQVDKVAGWLKSDFEKSDLNSLVYGLEILVRAKCFLVEKRYHAVLAALDGQNSQYGLEAFLLGKLEVAALRAICQYHVGDRAGAFGTLREAYEVSRLDDLDMPFIELGRDMRTLTSAAARELGVGIPKPWLEMICRKSSAYAKNLSFIISEYRSFNHLGCGSNELTNREREILTDLCRGLSKTEIAYSRNVSPNTIKMTVQIICSKLGAQNTANAIWIAASRNLIQSK
jgi:LuxR family maltose regulon positive regulatory protein